MVFCCSVIRPSRYLLLDLRTLFNQTLVSFFIYVAACDSSKTIFLFPIFPLLLTFTFYSLALLSFFLSNYRVHVYVCKEHLCLCECACRHTCKSSCSLGLILGWQEWRGSQHMCKSFNCGSWCLVLLRQHFLNPVQKSFQSAIILGSVCILKPRGLSHQMIKK